MRAVVFTNDGVRVDEVPEPRLQEPTDAIVRVGLSSICGSDLHLISGKTPGMREGAVIGHEYVGTVTQAGADVRGFREGDVVLGSFLIVCGRCPGCLSSRFNHCDNRRALGLGVLTGDLDGAQAESVRVPVADLNLRKLDGPLAEIALERVLLAGDILTTGFYAAALAEASPGDVVVVVGAGPVGLFCAEAARTLGARPILLDTDEHRIDFARETMGLEAEGAADMDPQATVARLTGGAMADAAIDAVGAPAAFKTAMKCVRAGGRVVVVGVYGPERYELPMGMVWVRGLDLRFSGMANVQAHWDEALQAVVDEKLDPTKVITHRIPLEDAPEGYELFASREAMKVVLIP